MSISHFTQPFKIKVNETHYDVTPEMSHTLDVVKTNAEKFHVNFKNVNYTAEIISADAHYKNITLRVNGNTHIVKLADKYDVLIDQLGLKNTTKLLSGNIKAPMPGLVLDVLVHIGQEVKAGDKVLILEAMKMENVITAPTDGVVKSINIQCGNAVEKNALLIEIV